MDDSNTFSFDEDVTTWDFWRRDSDENLLDVASDDSRDLCSSFYDVKDFRSWTQRDSWTRVEAAALTFGRDPSKIEWDEDETPVEVWDDLRLDQERRTVFLFFALNELIFKIRIAQQLNLLPTAIPPRRYAAWLKFVGIPSPTAISDLFTPRVDTLSVGGNTFQTSHGSNERERGCYQQRVDNNLLKIILALLLMTPGREIIRIADLAKAIEGRLDELDREVNPVEGKSLTLKAPTIAKHLKKVKKLTDASDEPYFATDNN